MTKASRESQHAGALFEKVLQHQLQVALQARRVAWWHHSTPAFRQIGRQFIRVAKALPDFVGVTAHGLPFAIECKSEKAARMQRDRIQPHQVAHFEATARAGGAAFLALELRPDADRWRRFLIPWRGAPWRKLRSADSLGLEDLLAMDPLLVGWPQNLGEFLDGCERRPAVDETPEPEITAAHEPTEPLDDYEEFNDPEVTR